MPKRCQHLNVEIDEYCEEVLVHTFRNGNVVDVTSGSGMILDYVDVACEDCGMKRRYYRGKRFPKWITRYIIQSIATS
jgi:RNase P subunit RPR2